MMLRCVSHVLASVLAALLALGSSAHANEGAGAAGSDGVGRLVCAAPGGRARVEDGSGWVAGAADTVVTAAHIFFPAGETIDPRSCIFRLYGADGTVRAAARVRYMRSPWTDRRMRGDSAQDVAVLKLDHPLAVTPVVAQPRGLGAQAVRLLSFPAGGGDGPRRRAERPMRFRWGRSMMPWRGCASPSRDGCSRAAWPPHRDRRAGSMSRGAVWWSGSMSAGCAAAENVSASASGSMPR